MFTELCWLLTLFDLSRKLVNAKDFGSCSRAMTIVFITTRPTVSISAEELRKKGFNFARILHRQLSPLHHDHLKHNMSCIEAFLVARKPLSRFTHSTTCVQIFFEMVSFCDKQHNHQREIALKCLFQGHHVGLNSKCELEYIGNDSSSHLLFLIHLMLSSIDSMVVPKIKKN